MHPAALLFTAILPFCVYFDLTEGRIPNALLYPAGAGLAAMALLAYGPAGLLRFLAGACLLLLCAFPLFLLRLTGAGDLKLLALGAGLAGPSALAALTVCTLVFSGCYALAAVLFRGIPLAGRFVRLAQYLSALRREGRRGAYIRPGGRENLALAVPLCFSFLCLFSAGILPC